jgi:hypothetical protein
MRTHQCSHGISFLQRCERCENDILHPQIPKTQEQSITEAAFDAAFATVHKTNNERYEKRDRAQWDAFRLFACKLENS